MVLAYNPNVNSGLLSGAEKLASAYLEKNRRKGIASGLEQINSGDWEGGVNTIAQADPDTALGLAQYKQKADDAFALQQARDAARNQLTPYQQEMLSLKRQKLAQGGSGSNGFGNTQAGLALRIASEPDKYSPEQVSWANNYLRSGDSDYTYNQAYQKAAGKKEGEFGGERANEAQLGYYRENGQKYITPGTEAEDEYLERNSKKLTNNEVASRTAKTVIDDIQAVKRLANANPDLAASWGSKLSFIPGSPAANIKARIESIKGNSGVDSLLKIKASGAGLGQIPQSQMDMLSNLIGNLDQIQSLPELLDVLNRYEKIYTDVYNNALSDNQKIKSRIRRPQASNEPQTDIIDASEYFK